MFLFLFIKCNSVAYDSCLFTIVMSHVHNILNVTDVCNHKFIRKFTMKMPYECFCVQCSVFRHEGGKTIDNNKRVCAWIDVQYTFYTYITKELYIHIHPSHTITCNRYGYQILFNNNCVQETTSQAFSQWMRIWKCAAWRIWIWELRIRWRRCSLCLTLFATFFDIWSMHACVCVSL